MRLFFQPACLPISHSVPVGQEMHALDDLRSVRSNYSYIDRCRTQVVLYICAGVRNIFDYPRLSQRGASWVFVYNVLIGFFTRDLPFDSCRTKSRDCLLMMVRYVLPGAEIVTLIGWWA